MADQSFVVLDASTVERVASDAMAWWEWQRDDKRARMTAEFEAAMALWKKMPWFVRVFGWGKPADPREPVGWSDSPWSSAGNTGRLWYQRAQSLLRSTQTGEMLHVDVVWWKTLTDWAESNTESGSAPHD